METILSDDRIRLLKMAECDPTHFLPKLMGKRSAQQLGPLLIFKKLPKANCRKIGGSSPNLVTLGSML
jgi:hypothetical protein